jgi:hypothetical protein
VYHNNVLLLSAGVVRSTSCNVYRLSLFLTTFYMVYFQPASKIKYAEN